VSAILATAWLLVVFGLLIVGPGTHTLIIVCDCENQSTFSAHFCELWL